MLPAFECRLVTRAVPDVQNLNALGFLADVMEDATGTNHDFAQSTFRASRIGWSNVRKVWSELERARVLNPQQPATPRNPRPPLMHTHPCNLLKGLVAGGRIELPT